MSIHYTEQERAAIALRHVLQIDRQARWFQEREEQKAFRRGGQLAVDKLRSDRTKRLLTAILPFKWGEK